MKPARRRIALAIAGVVVVVLGLLVRAIGADPWAGPAGTALYAVLVYLLVAFVVSTARPLIVAAAAITICAAIELAQLTPGPAALGDLWPPIRLVLGSTFDAVDLPGYLVGVLLGAGADGLVTSRLRRHRRHPHRRSRPRSRNHRSSPKSAGTSTRSPSR